MHNGWHYLLLDPTVPGLIPSKEKIVDVAEINQQHCLEEYGHWLENVDPTHLILPCDKYVQKKVGSKF